jgi:hypothetical protein
LTIPNPSVNHSREMPSAHPTMSLALLVQVGAIAGPPGACSIIGNCGIGFEPFVTT